MQRREVSLYRILVESLRPVRMNLDCPERDSDRDVPRMHVRLGARTNRSGPGQIPLEGRLVKERLQGVERFEVKGLIRDGLSHEVRVAHLPHVPISSLNPLGSRDEFGLNLRRRGSELGNVGTNGCIESAPGYAIVGHRFAPSKSRTARTGSQGPAPHSNSL